MKETAKLTAGLATICLCAATVLAVANLVTEGPRRRAQARERQDNLRLILPDFRNDPSEEATTYPVSDPEGRPAGKVTFYIARDNAADGDVVALAGEATSGQGFGGEVTVLAGLEPDGEILNVIVTSHSETPGLGTQVTDRARTRYIWEAFSPSSEEGLAPSDYLDQYREKSAEQVGSSDFRVVTSKDELDSTAVLAVSGATVSSWAVGEAVKRICKAFGEHRAELVSP